MSRPLNLSFEAKERIDEVCDAFEDDILAGKAPKIRDYLSEFEGPVLVGLVRALVALELEYTRAQGKKPTVEDYGELLPDAAHVLADLFSKTQRLNAAVAVDTPEQELPNGDQRPEPSQGNDAASNQEDQFPNIPGYTILKELGRGGMGVVYLARDANFGRLVALKTCLHADLTPEELERFKQEKHTLGKLNHPRIVPVHDAGEVDGVPFFTMEFANGGTLRDYVKRAETLPPRQAAEIVIVLAEAVHHAHQSDVVHRDLKPSNVLVWFPKQAPKVPDTTEPAWKILFSDEAVLKISDFGLAKRSGSRGASHEETVPQAEKTPRIAPREDDVRPEGREGDGPTQSFHPPLVTRDGLVMGTPAYMSPEQAQGGKGRIDHRADVYALGGILYRLLGGRPPVEANRPTEGIKSVLTQPPPPLSKRIPQDLRLICERCLEKNPEDRYQSAEEVANRLSGYLRGIPDPTRPWPVHWMKFLGRNVFYFSPVLVGLLVTGVFALMSLYGPKPPVENGIPSGPQKQIVSPEERKRRAREKIKQLVESGKRYVVQDAPTWYQWRMNKAAILDREPKTGITIQSKEYSLLELVPATDLKKFRISAEVYHEQGESNSEVGIFFGGRQFDTPVGSVDVFYSVIWNDSTGPIVEPDGRHPRAGNPLMVCLDFRQMGRAVSLSPLKLRELGRIQTLGRMGGQRFLFTPRTQLATKQWRSVKITVTPETIQVEFDRQHKAQVSSDKFRKTYIRRFQRQLKALGIAPQEFDCGEGSIGLLIDDAVASCKNVTVQRL